MSITAPFGTSVAIGGQDEVFDSERVARRYDKDTDRLFLVYYPITPGFNANKWGVSPSSIDANIHTAINKPVVMYRKNPNLPFHTKQAGMYVHPTPEEASYELGYPMSAETYYNWQEKFAVGRVRNVDKRSNGYAFTLEILDPEVKSILKSDDYRNGVPGWTSPQILSRSGAYPSEEQSNYFDHWVISHIALVDVPAYGYDQSGVRAKCVGAEKECMITTRSASQENLGFCVKQATIDLVNAFSAANIGSSQSSQNETQVIKQMSSNENTSSSAVKIANAESTNEVLKYQAPTDGQWVKASVSDRPNPGHGEEGENVKRPAEGENPPQGNEPQQEQLQAKSLDEANTMLKQQAELIKELQKNFKTQVKELEQIRAERKFARLSFIIPRDMFKTDESHRKEVEKMMTQNIGEEWIIELWKAKREAAMSSSAPKMEQPLVAKSASVHEVPNFEQSNSSTSQQKPTMAQIQMELRNRILNGGDI